MIRRFYSKRSGFTLVEIIVAFAVFAIMASMVAQILDLAVRARNSNNLYAQELARQEQLLTVIQKENKYYTAPSGEYILSLEGETTDIKVGYQVKATDPTAVNQQEGINYFLSPVDYTGSTNGSPVGAGDPAGVGGASQMSRMDTRITGTAGIGAIMICQVVKDTYAYPDSSPFKLAPGHTRYLIECYATSKVDGVTTLRLEDVPYAQYRLYFFSKDEDPVGGGTFTDESTGKQYTKRTYKMASVVDCGLVNKPFSTITSGLNDMNTSAGTAVSGNNKFKVEPSANSVRIGTPFEGGGTRFESQFTRFYVEFDYDPELDIDSFGIHTTNADGQGVFKATPVYKDEYDSDGNPTYEEEGDKVNPCIYGAYMYGRNYTT